MFEIEILIVVFLPFSKYFLVKSLIAQEAQFEDKFYTFFNIYSTVFVNFLSFRNLSQLFKFFMVKEKKNEHLVNRTYIVKVVNLLIERNLDIAKSDTNHSDHILKEVKMSLTELILEKDHSNFNYCL